MRRTLPTLAAALLFALALLFATVSKAQDAARGRGPENDGLFTNVEFKVWDLSYYNDKILEAVLKASESGAAGRRARRSAAAALAERGNFFRDQGAPSFYKYALGDFRHAARLRPDDLDSKAKAKEIEDIYKSMGRPVPEYGSTDIVELYVAEPQCLALEPGKSYSYTGNVFGRAAVVYEFDARTGQTLSAAVAPTEGKGKVVFDLYFVERRRRRHALYMGSAKVDYRLPIGGTYLLRVYSESGESPYALKVGLN
jgi:hypothetical protein